MTFQSSIRLAPRPEQIATIANYFGLEPDSNAQAGEEEEGLLRSWQYEGEVTLTFGPNEDADTAEDWPYVLEVSYEDGHAALASGGRPALSDQSR